MDKPSKNFFFEKKKQKTFMPLRADSAGQRPIHPSRRTRPLVMASPTLVIASEAKQPRSHASTPSAFPRHASACWHPRLFTSKDFFFCKKRSKKTPNCPRPLSGHTVAPQPPRKIKSFLVTFFQKSNFFLTPFAS
jgi:hypothetical protein